MLQDKIRTSEHQGKAMIEELYARPFGVHLEQWHGQVEVGKECPMINFVLRDEGPVGYSPLNDDILSLLRKHPFEEQELLLNATLNRYTPTGKAIVWFHSHAVGSFEHLDQRIRMPRWASKIWHFRRYNEMAYDSKSEDFRPEKRINFCKRVASKAEEIVLHCVRCTG
jgi:hypothetical protein